MNYLLDILKLAIPHDPWCIAAYVLASVLFVAGLLIIRRSRRARGNVSRREAEAAHLRALASRHAKAHEFDPRGRN